MRFKEFSIKEDFTYLDPNMSGGLARSGDSDAIAELQTWLNDNGYDVLTIRFTRAIHSISTYCGRNASNPSIFSSISFCLASLCRF